MTTQIEIVPGLVVDQEMHQHAVHGLTRYLPAEDLKLTWENFIDENNWTLIPDPDGLGYKAENVLLRSQERTVKINVWMSPDLRAGTQPRPHNHPWAFVAHVLMGGYAEERYQLVDGAVCSATQTHVAGGCNEVPLETFHEVTSIMTPGRTLTLMICGEGRQGDWGYIDPGNGQFEPAQPDPGFRARLEALNPRMRSA